MTFAPAFCAPAAAILTNFLLKESLRVLPAKATMLICFCVMFRIRFV